MSKLLQFKNRKILPVMLSPMAGVTTAPFREICRGFAGRALEESKLKNFDAGNSKSGQRAAEQETVEPGVFVDEMVAARPFAKGRKALEKHLHFAPSETFRSMQLYCLDAEYAYKAAKRAAESGRVEHIDLNFGCPVRKVTSNGGGSAIPWKVNLYRDIVRAVVSAVKSSRPEILVSSKFRIGIDQGHETYLDAAKIAVEEGVQMLTLHARTTKQFYGGEADWIYIKHLRQVTPPEVLVFGNGDIWSVQNAAKMIRETSANGVAIGRGACGKPWLFYDLARFFLSGQDNFEPTRPKLGEVVEIALAHLEKNVAFFARGKKEHFEDAAVKDFRTALALYLKGFKVGAKTKQMLMLADTYEKVRELLQTLDLKQEYPQSVEGKPRGRTRANHRVVLPLGWLDSRV